jgi:2-keto-4-pentenoate hydratase
MTRVENLVTLAERMLRDYDTHDPGTAFAEGLDLSIADAYGVQAHVAHLREQRGEQLAGYKVGCVCRGNQQRHGLSHPVYGRLWSTEQYSDDVALSLGDFANLAIEGEFAVTLRRDIEPGDASIPTIAVAVDQVFTVIELHNLVLRSDDRGPELIANNAIHAGVIRSSGTRPPATAACTDLSVECDGRLVGSWLGRCWPDDVLQEVPWLVGELNKSGLRLRSGHTVLTGAWGPPLPLAGRRPSADTAPSLAQDNVMDPDRPRVGRVEVTSTISGSVAASFSPSRPRTL